jgi:signal transduction histidine kinase
MEIEVIDDGPGFSLERLPEGHGLENLISRLHLLFGPAARLDVDCGEAHTTVRLSLPMGGERPIHHRDTEFTEKT